jgi:membrane protein DedA with SNARE-associated domain
MGALTSLQVDAAISYLIAIIIPALDAIIPVLPSETAVIALGVATAGSADPRIGLLVAAAAAGAFLGDNLSYLIGRRFGPAAERRFFATPKGKRARAWAETSLQRFGTQLIIACRFIPGGRTAVTLTCGLTRYPRGRFMGATAAAAVIWALYAFFIGRLGGKAFEDKPWAGLLIASAATIIISALIEAVRRARARRRRSRGDAGQVETDDPGEHQGDGDELHRRDGVAERDHAHGRRPGGADPRPDRVGGPDLQVTQRRHEQPEADQRADREPGRRPRPGQPVAQLQEHRESRLEQPRGDEDHPRHHDTSPSASAPSCLAPRRGAGMSGP